LLRYRNERRRWLVTIGNLRVEVVADTERQAVREARRQHQLRASGDGVLREVIAIP